MGKPIPKGELDWLAALAAHGIKVQQPEAWYLNLKEGYAVLYYPNGEYVLMTIRQDELTGEWGILWDDGELPIFTPGHWPLHPAE